MNPMRKIAHISDIHFGKADPPVVDRLAEAVCALEPDVVVVSGDLTQRARTKQFIEARAFLDRLPTPRIVVPGNHDVPLYNVINRFARPLDKYKKYITPDLEPVYVDDELAIVGVNTARSFTIKDGRISDVQAGAIAARFEDLDKSLIKIVVTHHPFDVPAGSDNSIVERAQKIMPVIAASGADIFLSGHLHVSRISSSAHRYELPDGRALLIIQAGTAASTRGRGEANSFNLIEIASPALTVTRFECEDKETGFVPVNSEPFERTLSGWSRSLLANSS